MNCESWDLKAYVLGEATPEERRAVKAHAATCGTCREEVARLEGTRAALMCVREEEMPRRIAFISDKDVAPPWWQFWHMLPHVFLPAVTALALIAAVVYPWWVRTVVIQPPAPALAKAAAAPVNDADIEKRIQAAVAKAVAESERRQAQQTTALLAAADHKHQLELRGMQVAMEEDWRLKMKQLGTLYVAFNKLDDGTGR